MSERHDHHPRTEDVHVHVHFHGLTDAVASVLSVLTRIFHGIEELKVMSQSNSEALNSALTNIGTQLDQIQSDTGVIGTEVQALVAGMKAGDPITQAQIDQANALAARATAIEEALAAVKQTAAGTGGTGGASTTSGAAGGTP